MIHHNWDLVFCILDHLKKFKVAITTFYKLYENLPIRTTGNQIPTDTTISKGVTTKQFMVEKKQVRNAHLQRFLKHA